MYGNNPIRVSKEFKALIEEVMQQHINNGLKPPSVSQITKVMVDIIDRKELFYQIEQKY